MRRATCRRCSLLQPDAISSSRPSRATARATTMHGSVADALVAAEADGLKGHGLSRVPFYAAQAQAGKVDGFATPAVAASAPGADRDRRGATALPFRRSISRSRSCPPWPRARGRGRRDPPLASLRRRRPSGRAARAAQAWSRCSSPTRRPRMAPWGGRRGLFGTNPIAFACPLAGRDAARGRPVAVEGRARQRHAAPSRRASRFPKAGRSTRDGKPTTDPDAALRGTMVPMGDAKGTALALMVELLAAGLTGCEFRRRGKLVLRRRGPAARDRAAHHRVRSPAAFGGAAVASALPRSPPRSRRSRARACRARVGCRRGARRRNAGSTCRRRCSMRSSASVGRRLERKRPAQGGAHSVTGCVPVYWLSSGMLLGSAAFGIDCRYA